MDKNRKVMNGMIELFEKDIQVYDRQSSKGNQLKWNSGNMWYKADYTGYEGLAEYVVSKLLELSSLDKNEYILYRTEEMKYNYSVYKGCSSKNFLPEGWNLITLERLFQNTYHESLNKAIYSIADYENRVKFMVDQTSRITGLSDFGVYLSKLLSIDAFFLNEDRHTHNIAVLLDVEGIYHYCPVFDNGAALMSDTTMDYPLHVPFHELIENVKAKTFCSSFDEQLDIVENLYGQHIQFHFNKKELDSILDKESYYTEDVKKRVKDLLLSQRRKYQYLFH